MRDLDGALGLAAWLQVVAQPLGGKPALGQTGAGGTGGEEILRGEVAEARPVEIASLSNAVIERRSQRSKVRFDVQESGLRGCVGRAADEKLRSEEHTSELQSRNSISYAVFSDSVVERRSQRPEVRFDMQQSGLRGCVGGDRKSVV